MEPTLDNFVRVTDKPTIAPDEDLVFDCPMRNEQIHWAKAHTFNPAAIVFEDRVHMFFRAEDGLGADLGGHTSRLGHAVSDDGISFEVMPEPVLFPDNQYKEYEWHGGCEDPRICQREDGLFVLHYSMWNKSKSPSDMKIAARIGVATSTDLTHWTKHGPVFSNHDRMLHSWHKAAGVVQTLVDGRLVATKIDGTYYVYFGEFEIYLATSDDLIHWDPVLDDKGDLLNIIKARDGFFDSSLTEVGPPAVITDAGIELIYNGKNHPNDVAKHDAALAGGAYAPATLILDASHPAVVKSRPDKPFMQPELPFERSGQYPQGTIFAEALILFKDRWLLYYGTADTYVGVATAPYIG